MLEATTSNGEWRGNPAALMIQASGGQCASFGIADSDWYLSSGMLGGIGHMARKMAEGLYIVDGGAEYYTCLEGQPMMLGVRTVNLGHAQQTGLKARVIVTDAASKKEITKQEWPLDLNPGHEQTVSEAYTIHHWTNEGVVVTAFLLRGDTILDAVAHEVHVWRPKERKSFVTAKDGQFMLDGARWRAHGVNYMPSSGIGTEDGPYFERWLGARSYDPEIIERDLDHCKNMGLNAVSIFLYYDDMKAQNLLDLLRRLDAHGMKANLSLRPGTGFEFPWEKIRDMIAYNHLAENDTVFAYDIDWEPMFLKQKDREKWDAAWETWIVERYGSIENAEKDWGFKAPRDGAGKVTNPNRAQIETDGDWRRMVAAYRRCMDTILYKYYSRARALIRSVDPNHMVSFRMTEAGDPTMRWDDVLPYDFPYLAAAVDILEPEGYGRIGNWEKVKPGWFEYEYARYAAPMKPMMWAEAGVSAWDMSTNEASPKLLDAQGQFYRDFYRMMISSGATGVFWWWYPGGFRVGENSDFGIINCDGTDRADTKMIRENAKAFLDGTAPKPIDTWIEIDRDARADGISGIYDTVKADFWKAIEAGKVPGLRTAGTGTNSGNCPLLAVGNTPCNGTNPPKYLDGFFDSVEIQVASGQWVKVESGTTFPTPRPAGKPVVARVLVTNLGEAKWLREGPGAVMISTSTGSKAMLPKPVPHLESVQVVDVILADKDLKTPCDVTLSFSAEGRTPFGEKFKVALTQ